MMETASIRRVRPSEEGYILVIVMFMLALLIISMAVALPKVASDIQRDRELETFHRGMQYRRAIQLYYRKFNTYPPNVDALVKTNNLRFLRKKYIDPVTGKDDWKPIMFGQQKTPLAMGFFGQPLAGFGTFGMTGAGIGPAGGNGMPGANPIGGGIGSMNPTGGIGSSLNSTANPTTGTDASATGSTTPGATDANGNPTDPSAAGPGQIAGASPVPGQTFGGAGIVGFSPASPKSSILVYKKKNHYIEWEFTYSPLSDQGMMPMNPNNGIQPSQPGVGAPGTPFNGGLGGSPAAGGLGGSPQPPQPQQ